MKVLAVIVLCLWIAVSPHICMELVVSVGIPAWIVLPIASAVDFVIAIWIILIAVSASQ